MTFGAFAFGQNYFGEIPLVDITERPRVGGSPSDADDFLARKRLRREHEIDLFALGQALGVIDP